jgi:hypothetical protein
MTSEIILILVAVFLLVMALFYVYVEPEKNLNYEIVGRGNPREVARIINSPMSKNKIENHFIKGQAFEHVLHDVNAAAREYNEIINILNPGNAIIEMPHIVRIDTVLNRIEDFDQDLERVILADIRANIMPEDPFDVEITSDPQNVHDSNVNRNLASKYEKICYLNGEPRLTIPDILNATRHHPDQHAINRVLHTMEMDYLPISKLNDSEINIALNVLQRILSKDNINNRDSLIAAYCDALKDSYDTDKDYVVCSQGRISRIIESLTLLDNDKDLSSPAKTDEIVMSEFMGKAHKNLQEFISHLSANEKARYDKNDAEIDNELKRKLSESMLEEYRDILPPARLNNLINQAAAGI